MGDHRQERYHNDSRVRLRAPPHDARNSYTIRNMSTHSDVKVEMLNKTAEYYRRSIANYGQFSRAERKPRTKKQLEARLQVILKEIDSLTLVAN